MEEEITEQNISIMRPKLGMERGAYRHREKKQEVKQEKCDPEGLIKDSLNASREEFLYNGLQKARLDFPEIFPMQASVSTLSYDRMLALKTVIINNPDINPKTDGGVNNEQMGEMGSELCKGCKDKKCKKTHFGLIDFPEIKVEGKMVKQVVINPIFLETVIMILGSVCSECQSPMIREGIMEEEKIINLSSEKRLKAIFKLASKVGKCVSSTSCPLNRIYSKKDSKEDGKIHYFFNKGKAGKVVKGESAVLPMLEAYRIIDKIKDPHTLELLGFQVGSDYHPRNMFVRGLPVLPPALRVPIMMGNMMKQNPLTDVYISIINMVNTAPFDSNAIYKEIRKLFIGEKTDTSFRPISMILKGKTGKKGVIRNLMMGKIIDFSARAVIIGDPNLKINEVSLPYWIADLLAVPIFVYKHNIKEVEELLKANKVLFIERAQSGIGTPLIPFEGLQEVDLRYGDKIYRKLQDGDYIIFNRQPTLHQGSMMAHKVVLTNSPSIGLPQEILKSYNADFDGDEGNIYAIQSISALAELQELMSVDKCMTSFTQNRSIAGLVFNSVVGSTMLTEDGMNIDGSLFGEIISQFIGESGIFLYQDFRKLIRRAYDHNMVELRTDEELEEIYSKRTIEEMKKEGKSIEYLRYIPDNLKSISGKAVFSLALPENYSYERGNVKIVNSLLISGEITGTHIADNSVSIIHDVWWKYGSDVAVNVIFNIKTVVRYFLSKFSFTVGPEDCGFTPNKGIKAIANEIQDAVEEFLRKTYDFNIEFQSTAGRKISEQEKALQEDSIRKMNDQFTVMAARAIDKLKGTGIYYSYKSGSKAKEGTIAQILFMVGQVYEGANRPKPQIGGGLRCFLEFDNTLNLAYQGFCQSSLSEGLTPSEYMSMQLGSRISTITSGIYISQVGYNARALIRSLEGVVTNHLGSVTRGFNSLDCIQISFGDGFDPSKVTEINHKTRGQSYSPFKVNDISKYYNQLNGWVEE